MAAVAEVKKKGKGKGYSPGNDFYLARDSRKKKNAHCGHGRIMFINTTGLLS